MKERIRRFAGPLFFLFVLFLAAGGPAAAQAKGPRVVKVAEGVYAFIGGGGRTNSGFVVTKKGVVVIDTQGPKALALELRKRIREVTKKPVLYVINTHYHGDHTFGNQYFSEAGAIISQINTRRDMLKKDKKNRAMFRKFFGRKSLRDFVLTLPNLTFKEKLIIRSVEKPLRLIHTPRAHTSGDIVVFMPEDSVVFTGDILYKGRLPWLGDGSLEGSIRAVDMLLGLRAETYIPGHGGVATRKDVLEYKKYLLALRREVRRLMAEGKTLAEIKREIRLPAFRKYRKYRKWLPLNAEKAYMELEREGGR